VITREDLYELVWSTPMIKVAEKFEVSGSYLARVCNELRVPRVVSQIVSPPPCHAVL
jgi:hypothetical protein